MVIKMKLGYLSDLTGDVIEFLGRNQIGHVELLCDRSMNFDVEKMSASDLQMLRSRLEQNHVRLDSLAWFVTNQLESDKGQQKKNIAYFRKLIACAKDFQTSLISIGTIHHPSLDIRNHMEEALELYETNFREYAHIAEQEGIRLSIENCPEFGNLAYSPEALDAMFERVPPEPSASNLIPLTSHGKELTQSAFCDTFPTEFLRFMRRIRKFWRTTCSATALPAGCSATKRRKSRAFIGATVCRGWASSTGRTCLMGFMRLGLTVRYLLKWRIPLLRRPGLLG